MNSKEATRTKPDVLAESRLAPAMLRLATCREKSTLDELLVELVREQVNGAATALVAYDAAHEKQISVLAVSGVTAEKQQQFLAGATQRLPLPPTGKNDDNPCWLLLDSDDPDPSANVLMLIQMYHSIHELMARSTHDRLTRLFNRHSLQDTLQHIYGHTPERRKPRSESQQTHGWVMALLDIDHFKTVNDQFGHLVGDEVLLAFSDLMMNSFRQHDRLFRYGGEEFVVLMADISMVDAENVLNRFREQVAHYDFPHKRQLTVSVGFAAVDLDSPAESVLEQADRALYSAKHHGRNRVEKVL